MEGDLWRITEASYQQAAPICQPRELVIMQTSSSLKKDFRGLSPGFLLIQLPVESIEQLSIQFSAKFTSTETIKKDKCLLLRQ